MPGPMPRRRLFQPVPVERWAALQAFLVWALGGHRRWLESLKNERKNENPHILLQIPNIFPFTGDFSISEDSTIWVQLLRGLVDRSEDDVPALPALPRAPTSRRPIGRWICQWSGSRRTVWGSWSSPPGPAEPPGEQQSLAKILPA